MGRESLRLALAILLLLQIFVVSISFMVLRGQSFPWATVVYVDSNVSPNDVCVIGDYIVVGGWVESNGSFYGFVSVLDLYGNLRWFARFPESPSYVSSLLCIDDAIYVVGSYGGKAFVAALNIVSPTIRWIKVFDRIDAFVGIDKGLDNYLYLLGVSRGYVAPSGAVLVKMDTDGDPVWVKLVPLPMASALTIAGGIVASKVDTFLYAVLLANMSEGVGGYDVLAMKVSRSGEVLWIKAFGTTLNDYPMDVVESGSCIAIVGGYESSPGTVKPMIMELHRDGTAFMSEVQTTRATILLGVDVSSNGVLYAAGSYGQEGVVMVQEPGLIQVKLATLGGDIGSSLIRSIKVLDSGFVVAGWIYFRSKKSLLVVRIDSLREEELAGDFTYRIDLGSRVPLNSVPISVKSYGAQSMDLNTLVTSPNTSLEQPSSLEVLRAAPPWAATTYTVTVVRTETVTKTVPVTVTKVTTVVQSVVEIVTRMSIQTVTQEIVEKIVEYRTLTKTVLSTVTATTVSRSVIIVASPITVTLIATRTTTVSPEPFLGFVGEPSTAFALGIVIGLTPISVVAIKLLRKPVPVPTSTTMRAQPTALSRKCPFCGRDVPEQASFCPYCGAYLGTDETSVYSDEKSG